METDFKGRERTDDSSSCNFARGVERKRGNEQIGLRVRSRGDPQQTPVVVRTTEPRCGFLAFILHCSSLFEGVKLCTVLSYEI